MRGYQFGHIETYAVAGGGKRKNRDRRWSAQEILAEAERLAGASAHVPKKGRAPMVIPGSCGSFKALRQRHAEAADLRESFDYTNPKTGKRTKRKRKLRKDARTLYTSVFSLPVRTEEALQDPTIMRAALRAMRMARNFERRRLDAAGGELAMSVIHLDEEHVHIHCYGLDRTLGRVRDLHPGEAAKHHVVEGSGGLGLDKSTKNKLGNKAYCDAMRGWQDEIHQQVFARIGLLRYGPKKERLTRDQYNARKAAAMAGAEQLEAVESTRAMRKKVRAVQATQSELGDLLAAQEQQNMQDRQALAEACQEVTEARAEVADQLAQAARERAALREEREALERERMDDQRAREERKRTVELYMSEMPDLLADDVLLVAEGDRGPVLEKGANFAKTERVKRVAAARKSLPVSLRTSFEGLWLKARKKAEDAPKAFQPDGLWGPWRDAFVTIREALRSRQEIAATGRDPERNLTVIERAAVAVGIAARAEDPILARALQHAVTEARTRRRMAEGSTLRDRDGPEI